MRWRDVGIVSVGDGSGGVPFTAYRGAVAQVGHTSVGGHRIVPAVDWTGTASEDPELPDWVEEEYGGLHEGLEQADITFQDETELMAELEQSAVPPPKRAPGRPRKVKVA